ncbi:MAG TPA: hypothetical protein VI584_03235 [Nitrospiria bacterium]|nr:hypothetical protein [Nitrospiria bacterium]
MVKKSLFLRLWSILILSTILITGCSGLKEAPREQFSGRFEDAPLTLRLICSHYPDPGKEIDGQDLDTKIFEGSIGIGKVRDSRKRSDNVGYMWSNPPFWAPWLDSKLDLKLEEGIEVDEILLDDVKKVLNLSNFITEDIPNPKGNPSVILDLEIIETKINSSPGKWTELRGTIYGAFIFKAVIVDPETGRDLWGGTFAGKYNIKVFYFLKRYHEEVLNRAYCMALDSFSKEINTDKFKNSVKDGSTL